MNRRGHFVPGITGEALNVNGLMMWPRSTVERNQFTYGLGELLVRAVRGCFGVSHCID